MKKKNIRIIAIGLIIVILIFLKEVVNICMVLYTVLVLSPFILVESLGYPLMWLTYGIIFYLFFKADIITKITNFKMNVSLKLLIIYVLGVIIYSIYHYHAYGYILAL